MILGFQYIRDQRAWTLPNIDSMKIQDVIMLLVQRKEAAKMRENSTKEMPSLTSLLVICRGFENKIVTFLKR
jgi:hypothetical protein